MTHGSLFSGIGGFDLAAQWMGWDNIFHCEWNTFGQKVLKYYWPKAISYGDITKTDFTIHRGAIDILSGGFPCQPYSQAGKRLGKEDDRHLWPEMLRAIGEIQPRWVVGENVRGLTNWNGGMVFDEVQADMEAKGYEVLPFLLPACAVNAPHRRDRIWFVANSEKAGRRKGLRQGVDFEGRKVAEFNKGWDSLRVNLRTGADFSGIIADCSNSGIEGLRRDRSIGSVGEIRDKQFTGFLPSAWEDFPTQSPVCSGNDGLQPELAGITFSKHRNESIKAYGNSVVPQVVLQIFKAIEQYEK